MNPMKKKTVRILFCVLLVTVLVSAFSMTAFAAGDVAGAIENTWNAAKSQIQTVVTESTDSLNSQLRAFCLPALFSR